MIGNLVEVLFPSVMALLSLYVAYLGMRKLRDWWKWNTGEQVSITDVDSNSTDVIVQGEVDADHETDLLESPYFRKECVLYQYNVEREGEQNAVEEEFDAVPFYLRDDTGKAYIDSELARVSLTPETDTWTESEQQVGVRHNGSVGVENSRNQHRVSERRIEPGDDITVFGQGGEYEGADAVVEIKGSGNNGEFIISDSDTRGTSRKLFIQGLAFITVGVGLSVGAAYFLLAVVHVI